MAAGACAMHRVQARRNGRAHPALAAGTPRTNGWWSSATRSAAVRLTDVADGLEVDCSRTRTAPCS